MPIGRAQFIAQFAKQALDSRISLFLGAGGSCDVAILIGPLYLLLLLRSFKYQQANQQIIINWHSIMLIILARLPSGRN